MASTSRVHIYSRCTNRTQLEPGPEPTVQLPTNNPRTMVGGRWKTSHRIGKSVDVTGGRMANCLCLATN